MDYCMKDIDRMKEEAMVINNEAPIMAKLEEIEKKLIETRSVLKSVIENINYPKTDGLDGKMEHENMNGWVDSINGLAHDCLGMANHVHKLLFGG